MPGRWIAGVLRLVKDGDGDCVAILVTSEGAPAAARRPDRVALDALACEVFASGIGRGGCDLGLDTVGVSVDSPAGGWGFKPTGDAKAKHSILLILEDHAVQSFQGSGAVDNAGAVVAGKDEAAGLFEDGVIIAVDPG